MTGNVQVKAYDKIDMMEIERLRRHHAWVADPIYCACEAVRQMPFYDWVQGLKAPMDFKPAAEQLFYHSATFPKAMGLMLGTTPLGENAMMPFYSRHAFGEADHHQMLLRWMLQHGLLSEADAINDVITTPMTNACVNIAYQIALEADRYKWVLTINCGIERCSNDFFKAVAPKMHDIGAGDEYFDIHVEADEYHSIMGMEHLEPQDPNSRRGRQLIAKALEGISLWAAMLHSWIGIDLIPQFDLDGKLIETAKA